MVAGTEDARGAAPGAEVRRVTGRDEAVAAGGEAELRRGLRHAVVRKDGPRAAEVVGGEDPELPVDRVAQHQPAPAAGVERHAVVERRGVIVDEGRVPGRPTIGGAVDPRRVARPDGEDHGPLRAACLDVTEQEAVRARGAHVLPGPAAVGRAEHPARAAVGDAAAGHPCCSPVDRVEAAEALVGVDDGLAPRQCSAVVVAPRSRGGLGPQRPRSRRTSRCRGRGRRGGRWTGRELRVVACQHPAPACAVLSRCHTRRPPQLSGEVCRPVDRSGPRGRSVSTPRR